MIRLRSAKFKNFRLLRDVEIEFSADFDKPLTVIRAENESGKTTLLNGLVWGLFGDNALPAKRSAFRLHPIDWDTEAEGRTVEIIVEVRFEAVTEDEETKSYTSIRRAVERLDGTDFVSQRSDLDVLEHTKAGDRRLKNPDAVIESLLPSALKDVFFTDSDRALVWIEASDAQSVKRDRVEKAVRSLLGLELLEKAEEHVRRARAEIVQRTRKEAGGTAVASLADRLTAIDADLARERTSLAEAKQDRDAAAARHRKAGEQLRNLLAAGGADRKRLAKELETEQARIGSETKRLGELQRSHRDLLNRSSIGIALAEEQLDKAASLLRDLEDRKVIPNTLPSIIEDRLHRQSCICGADLSAGSEARRHLEQLLADSRHADEAGELLAVLSTTAQQLLRDPVGPEWCERARQSLAQIKASRDARTDAELAVRNLRVKIEDIPDKDITAFEAEEREQQSILQGLAAEVGRIEARLDRLEGEKREIDAKLQQALRNERQLVARAAEEKATKDLLEVVTTTIDALKSDKLVEVSERMNDIFLKMIVADPEQNAIVRKAELTQDHDIVVTGPRGRRLDPDRDLNGAGRRALTLAFILALTKVSGVKAPSIIDTPIGMMSSQVRFNTVKYAAEHSSQLVLFLTRSEITGIEPLLDRYAGRSLTLTNTAHYPAQLANDPGTGRQEALVCGCAHNAYCAVCERRGIAVDVGE